MHLIPFLPKVQDYNNDIIDDTISYSNLLPYTGFYNNCPLDEGSLLICDTLCNDFDNIPQLTNQKIIFYDAALLIMAKLHNPNILTYYYGIDHPQILYYLYSYVDGFVLDSNILDDIDKVVSIATECKLFNKKLFAEKNNTCIKYCPARLSCRIWLSHNRGDIKCIKDTFLQYTTNELTMNQVDILNNYIDAFIINSNGV